MNFQREIRAETDKDSVLKDGRTMTLQRSGHGYYTMYINGRFYGNYDSVSEAVKDYEGIPS